MKTRASCNASFHCTIAFTLQTEENETRRYNEKDTGLVTRSMEIGTSSSSFTSNCASFGLTMRSNHNTPHPPPTRRQTAATGNIIYCELTNTCSEAPADNACLNTTCRQSLSTASTVTVNSSTTRDVRRDQLDSNTFDQPPTAPEEPIHAWIVTCARRASTAARGGTALSPSRWVW